LAKKETGFKLAGRATLSGKPTAGLLLFALDRPIQMDETRFVRFVFEETFGGDQVYVNRLHLYESTPDVVRLFVDDHNMLGASLAGSAPGRPKGGHIEGDGGGSSSAVNTPATMEAASVRLDERIDDSLAKLQESLVLQYASDVNESFSSNISATADSPARTAGRPSLTGRKRRDSHAGNRQEEPNSDDDGGFGVHLHRSGSMDIHIPSSSARRLGTHVRISKAESDEKGPYGGGSKTVVPSGPFVPQLSAWEISQAMRTPLSDQLASMCEQVAQLADSRGVTNHGLGGRGDSSSSDSRTEPASMAAGKAGSTADSKFGGEVKDANHHHHHYHPAHINTSTAQTDYHASVEQGEGVEPILMSLRACARQASALENRVSACESELASLRGMVRQVLAAHTNAAIPLEPANAGDTEHHTTTSAHADRTTSGTAPTEDTRLKNVVLSVLTRWEQDMIGSVIEPHLASVIGRFERQVDERITRIHRGAPSLREAKREALSWAVGADIRPNDGPVPAHTDPMAIEQEVLVRRLQEKMEAKARTLRAIQEIQRSPSTKSGEEDKTPSSLVVPSLAKYQGTSVCV
jgi:hypothetical protein